MSESRLRQVERAANKIHHKLYNAISSLDRLLVLNLLKDYGSQLQPRDKQYQDPGLIMILNINKRLKPPSAKQTFTPSPDNQNTSKSTQVVDFG
ncbi:MAG: hypothetical protein IPP74_01370 [Alphaproteobacteria bacterium]|nr:hypothetical protein [Alphaproteobacteria bacterium]